MERAYTVDPTNGKTTALTPVLCKDEGKELQQLIFNNFDILPGDQIDPDSPCRWLLIKKEMPVPDPATGQPRWSLDFLFVDDKGTPTFVECKRYNDTRARREVIGQVLEYAANGPLYWTRANLRSHAEETANQMGKKIESEVQALVADWDSIDDFFSEVERKLTAGELRIIFFLDQAPNELKRLVEFLNKQMNLAEVLLVEARQYRVKDLTIVVPRLFGFTEQARAVKLLSSGAANRPPVATDWVAFAANAKDKVLAADAIETLHRLFERCRELGAEIAWGRGTVTASFSPKWAMFGTISPFSIAASGAMDVHLSTFSDTAPRVAFRESFLQVIGTQIEFPAKYLDAWVTCKAGSWLSKADVVIEALSVAIEAAKGAANEQGTVTKE